VEARPATSQGFNASTRRLASFHGGERQQSQSRPSTQQGRVVLRAATPDSRVPTAAQRITAPPRPVSTTAASRSPALQPPARAGSNSSSRRRSSTPQGLGNRRASALYPVALERHAHASGVAASVICAAEDDRRLELSAPGTAKHEPRSGTNGALHVNLPPEKEEDGSAHGSPNDAHAEGEDLEESIAQAQRERRAATPCSSSDDDDAVNDGDDAGRHDVPVTLAEHGALMDPAVLAQDDYDDRKFLDDLADVPSHRAWWRPQPDEYDVESEAAAAGLTPLRVRRRVDGPAQRSEEELQAAAALQAERVPERVVLRRAQHKVDGLPLLETRLRDDIARAMQRQRDTFTAPFIQTLARVDRRAVDADGARQTHGHKEGADRGRLRALEDRHWRHLVEVNRIRVEQIALRARADEFTVRTTSMSVYENSTYKSRFATAVARDVNAFRRILENESKVVINGAWRDITHAERGQEAAATTAAATDSAPSPTIHNPAVPRLAHQFMNLGPTVQTIASPMSGTFSASSATHHSTFSALTHDSDEHPRAKSPRRATAVMLEEPVPEESAGEEPAEDHAFLHAAVTDDPRIEGEHHGEQPQSLHRDGAPISFKAVAKRLALLGASFRNRGGGDGCRRDPHDFERSERLPPQRRHVSQPFGEPFATMPEPSMTFDTVSPIIVEEPDGSPAKGLPPLSPPPLSPTPSGSGPVVNKDWLLEALRNTKVTMSATGGVARSPGARRQLLSSRSDSASTGSASVASTRRSSGACDVEGLGGFYRQLRHESLAARIQYPRFSTRGKKGTRKLDAVSAMMVERRKSVAPSSQDDSMWRPDASTLGVAGLYADTPAARRRSVHVPRFERSAAVVTVDSAKGDGGFTSQPYTALRCEATGSSLPDFPPPLRMREAADDHRPTSEMAAGALVDYHARPVTPGRADHLRNADLLQIAAQQQHAARLAAAGAAPRRDEAAENQAARAEMRQQWQKDVLRWTLIDLCAAGRHPESAELVWFDLGDDDDDDDDDHDADELAFAIQVRDPLTALSGDCTSDIGLATDADTIWELRDSDFE
jgi:hypothetical protein